MRTFFIAILAIFCSVSYTQNPVAYNLFNSNGTKVVWTEMIKDLANQDIVFFGELHNNAVAHWLELEVTKCLYKNNSDLTLGAEMFESDNQLIMDEFLSGTIRLKDFENEMRLWNNYKTDYKPLLMFAKNNKLKFIATNIPRRYAALVNMKGFKGLNSLSSEAKKFIASLPIPYSDTVKCYADMLRMGTHMPGAHINTANIAKSQAIKDATMAHFILNSCNKGGLFLHFNGSYHSDNHQGIVWYIKQNSEKYMVRTISIVTQDDISNVDKENLNKADYIIVVNNDFTNTY